MSDRRFDNINPSGAAAFCCVAGLLCVSHVHAANQDGVLVSPEAALTAGAMMAVLDPGSGGFYNPAALAALSRDSFDVNAAVYTVGLRKADKFVRVHLPSRDVTSSARWIDFTSIPSAVGYQHRLAEGVGLSLGVWQPQRDFVTLNASVDERDTFPSGLARVTRRVSFSQRLDQTHGGASLGLNVLPGLRIGFGLLAVYATSDTAFEFASSFTPVSPVAGKSTPQTFGLLSDREATARLGLRGNFGIQWDITRTLTIAGVVRSPVVRMTTLGSRAATLGSVDRNAAGNPIIGFVDTPIDSVQPTLLEPLRVFFGAAIRFPHTRVSLEADYTAALNDSGDPRRAVVNVRAGVLQQWGEHFWIGWGVFSDRQHREPRGGSPDVDYRGFTTGIQFRSPKVIRALHGSDRWDLLGTFALRWAFGKGRLPPFTIDDRDADSRDPDAAVFYQEIAVNIGTTLKF